MAPKNKDKRDNPQASIASETISERLKGATNDIIRLVKSVGMEIEERIAIQDEVDNISKETESMLNRIDSIAKSNQTKILLAYKIFLEHNLEAVDQRLKALG